VYWWRSSSIEQIKAIVEKDHRSKMHTFEQWHNRFYQRCGCFNHPYNSTLLTHVLQIFEQLLVQKQPLKKPL
jgi:hypothetical protein